MTADNKAMKAALSDDKFGKKFGALGVSVYDASGEIRSLKEIFTDMSAVMNEMATQQRDSLIQDVTECVFITDNTAKRS